MNRFIHYGLVLLAIASISAGILSKVNASTAPVIRENSLKKVFEARKEVLPLAVEFDQESLKSSDFEFIPGKNSDGEIVGYVTTVVQAGYSGDINYVLGFDKNGIITGLKIITQTETPGLGTNIMNPDWQKLWKGRDVSYQFNKPVDAFAGATITPNAVYTGIIRALKAYEEVKN